MAHKSQIVATLIAGASVTNIDKLCIKWQGIKFQTDDDIKRVPNSGKMCWQRGSVARETLNWMFA